MLKSLWNVMRVSWRTGDLSGKRWKRTLENYQKAFKILIRPQIKCKQSSHNSKQPLLEEQFWNINIKKGCDYNLGDFVFFIQLPITEIQDQKGICLFLVVTRIYMGFPGGSDSKESACNAGDPGSIPGQEDLLQKGTATHSSFLAWRTPWTEEPGELQSIGSQRNGHDWVTNTHT